jgi:hypothetical protein
MKKIAVIALALASMLASASAQSDLFSSIQDWTGTGTNEAGFVIDWYNGTTSEASLMWGYRWDGTATGEQMFDAIIAGDSRLSAEVSGPTAYGTAVYGLGYEPNGNPIQLSPSLTFDSQHLVIIDNDTNVDDSRVAVNPGDLWLEGWFSAGYWAYYTSTDARLSLNESDWDANYDGMTFTTLNNGDFNGFVFDADFAYPGPVPSGFVAADPVPEPATWALLFSGGISLFFLCKRHSLKKSSAPVSRS